MACNYNAEATEAGECTFPNPTLCETCSGEFDGTGLVLVNELGVDGSCIYLGCTDPSGMNFDPTSTLDDGSCEYLSLIQTKSSNMIVYPNPGTQAIHILSPRHVRGIKVEWQNTMGSVIFSKFYDEIYANLPLKIDIQSIPQGIYLLTLSSLDNTEYLFWIKH